ncbi:MAG: branched-chain amino acid ABC transporter permease [Alphaproteobacteria bacterium]
MTSYLISIVATAGIYALLALGLNVIWGMTGMINLGLAGFFAVGAYGSALVTKAAGLPIAVGVLVGFGVAALAGALLTLITLRLRGDYLAIVTLGFAEVVRLVASNEIWLTNGTDGISGIPGPWRGELTPIAFNMVFCVIALGVALVALVATHRLRNSPFGRVLRAIRDDDVVARVAGKSVNLFKIQAFAVGGGLMGVAGALYGHYTSYIAPDLFRPLITIYIFLALTAGGTGNNLGAVAGAFILLAIMESTRFLADLAPDLGGAQVAALREIVIALVLILVLRFRPAGLLPERLPRHRPGASHQS